MQQKCGNNQRAKEYDLNSYDSQHLFVKLRELAAQKNIGSSGRHFLFFSCLYLHFRESEWR